MSDWTIVQYGGEAEGVYKPPSRARVIKAVSPRIFQPSALVGEGTCPCCNARLEPRYMESEPTDRLPSWAWCSCCGWWWRSEQFAGTWLFTFGKDPLCDHMVAEWRS